MDAATLVRRKTGKICGFEGTKDMWAKVEQRHMKNQEGLKVVSSETAKCGRDA